MNRQRNNALWGIVSGLGIGLLAIGAVQLNPARAQQATPTLPPVTVVAAPVSGPTAQSAGSASNNAPLPGGTLILLQRSQAIAQLPSGIPLALQPEQYGSQAASNGKLGVRMTKANGKASLTLVDLVGGQTTPIPNGTNLSAPAIVWKKDASGFAFYEFPLPGAASTLNGAIMYYDVGGSASHPLIPSPGANVTGAALAWSPDGRYLVYTLTTAASGAAPTKPNSQALLFDTTTNTSKPLPADTSNFLFWDRTSQGFFVAHTDSVANTSQILYYGLNTLTTPVTLTPASTLDLLSDLSSDGKRIVVSSSPGGKNPAAFNLYIQAITGGDRKAITTFKGSDQAITALVWATDGIYYSLSGAGGDSTWRIDLDGKNAHQVASGTLLGIVGAH